MKLSSPPPGHPEGRREVALDTFSRNRTDCTTLRESSASSPSPSSSTLPAHPPRGVSGPNISRDRSTDPLRKRSTKKRRRADPHGNSKKRKSSKKSKKKHHKKKRRVSTSSSSPSPSSGPRSRSTSRSRSRPSFSETHRPTPCPYTGASPCPSPSANQAGIVTNRKATGWDVGPCGRKLSGGAGQQGGNGALPSSTNCRHGERGGAGGEREEENIQRHNPKTYEKAFGVAIPSGQYSFVSEDTDLTPLLPGVPGKIAEDPVRTTSEGAGAVRLSPGSQNSTAAINRDDSPGSRSGGAPAVPPALGIFRLLKEANEGEKAREARKSDDSVGGLNRGPAQGGPGSNKVTSKTHPHLFWQCWNCSADNYKTRHQCFRCNRLYMQ